MEMDPNTLKAALIAQFPIQETDKPPIAEATLVEFLGDMLDSGVDEESILSALHKKEPDASLSADHHAIICLIDSCCSVVITRAEFPTEISRRLMGVIACITRLALNEGIECLSQNRGALKVLESLIDLTIGWSDIRGNPRDSVEQKFQSSLVGLSLLTESPNSGESYLEARDNLLTLLQNDIAGFSAKEKRRIGKLEQRMVDAEAGHFKTLQSKNLAAQTVNAAMENQQLPRPIVEFLQGVWLDSLQLILTRQGLQSEEWLRATKLTETLVMTMQPENMPTGQAAITEQPQEPTLTLEGTTEIEEGVDTFPKEGAEPIQEPNTDPKESLEAQDLYRIIEHLPEELRKSLVALEHNLDAADAELSIIESIHVDIMTGEPQSGHEFAPIATDEGLLDENTSVSKSLLAPVEKLKPGQWFIYTEDAQPSRHIKLTLKVDGLKQLLFTNRNGAKVLQVNYSEFAYLMSSETATALPPPGAITLSLRTSLSNLVKKQVKKEKVIKERRKELAAAKRKKEMEDTQFVLVAVRKDQLQSTGELVDHKKASELVSRLNLGATIKLGEAGKNFVDARLAVDDPSDDKIIFVDQTGLNLGEYTKDQIADLIAGGQCEVVDSGTTEQDDFRSVITRMRKKKNLAEDS